MAPFLDLKKDYLGRKKLYDKAILIALESGSYILGKEVRSFEEKFSSYLGVKNCIGVGNGLEALQISLLALGIGKGDEVITTPLSAMATTLAIVAVGAKPVFIDVDDHGLIYPEKIFHNINNKTKAIIAVDLYGGSPDYKNITSICKEKNLFLIEDAAQAHGSVFKNKKLGTWGDLGCFSFYPTKNLGAFGDGGAIVTNNEVLAKACFEIRDYGQSGKYLHKRYGLNSRLDEIQAAILKVKLRYLDHDNAKRRDIAFLYHNEISKIKWMKVVNQIDQNYNFHIFAVRLQNQNIRDELANFLRKNGVGTAVHYPTTIPDQALFNNRYINLEIDNARDMANTILSLPCNPSMTKKDAQQVIRLLDTFSFNNFRT